MPIVVDIQLFAEIENKYEISMEWKGVDFHVH